MHEWKATLPGASTPLVHFTLPEQSREVWNERLERWAEQIGVKVSTSAQHHSTDTMAMGKDGRPFMDEDGCTPI